MMARTYLSGRSALRLAQRLSFLVFILALGFPSAVSAGLIGRGPNMVYDTVLDITWTRQAGDGVQRDWLSANAWAAALVFEGFDDWRLPFASVAAGVGPAAAYGCTGAGGADEVACRDNEMGYMFYYNLDGNLGDDKTGTQTALGGETLTGIQGSPFPYFSGTLAPDPGFAFRFNFFDGAQSPGVAGNSQRFAWAVRPGDVAAAAVPEPTSLLLFGVGALGLAFTRRNGSAASRRG